VRHAPVLHQRRVKPAAYAEQVIDNTLALLAEIVTTDDVIAEWSGQPGL
jgi:hypothetical protein